MAGSFTTLTASSTVTFSAGAQTGYLWQSTNAGGVGSWVSVASISSAGALTVSNDTNITATFTGSNTTALFTPVTINLAWASTLATSRGGTNFNGSGLTLGDLLYASSGTAFTRLAGNNSANTRKFLVSTSSGGVATAPIWDFVTLADISNISYNFTSIGFNMSPPTNAYISTTNRTAILNANYQVSLGGTYTAISTTTSIIDLDITTTHVSTTSALTTSAALQLTPNANATSGGITSHYALLIGAGTNSGGTVTSSYGIYNNVQTYATTNYGYYQAGTFTKASDVGMQLSSSFTPAATANNYQLNINPTYTSTSAVFTTAYTTYIHSLFTVSTNNATTISELVLAPNFTVSGVGTVTDALCSLINPTINITTASTGVRVTNLIGVKIQVAASPTITTASTVVSNYYGLYSGTIPTLTGAGKFTTVYGGYFAAPLTTTTDASTGSVALWADSLQVGGAVSGAPVAGTIRVGAVTGGIICASAALATNTTVGFLYAPSCAGQPSVAPTPITTGTIPVVFDTTNNALMCYNSVAGVPKWMGVGECLIYDQTGDAVTTSYTTSTLPTVFNHLHIVIMARTTYNVAAESAICRPNSDATTANYSYTQTYIQTTVGTNSGYTTDTAANVDAFVGYISNAFMNSTTTNLSTNDFRIHQYNNTGIYKNMFGTSEATGPTITTTRYIRSHFMTTWKSTAAITTLNFRTNQTSAFSALSRIMVYGYM